MSNGLRAASSGQHAAGTDAHNPPLAARFGAAAFVETDDNDDSGEENILSFDALKKAFAQISAVEEELDEADTTANGDVCTAEEDPSSTDSVPEEEFDLRDLSTDSWQSETKNALSPRSVIEAILFTGNQDNRGIAAERIAEKMRNVLPEEVDREVAALNEQYVRLQKPYWIMHEPTGYRMVLRSEYEPIRNNFAGKERSVRLSQAAIDTLALVAYKQPITAEEVTALRHEASLPLLKQLVKRGLLRMEKETTDEKPAVHFRTAERFLSLLQLETLADLPTLEDFGQ